MNTADALGSNYLLTRKLGSGAMGTVYAGQDRSGRPYAIKVLRSEYADDPAVVQRFVQERATLLGVQHPNVLRTHDLVVEGSRLAIVMDLVTGGDLRGYLNRRGTLPPAEAAWLTSAVAAGLDSVHRAGVVHRDVKPENILLTDVGGHPNPQVADFGIARITEANTATRASVAVGTPAYMAPEVVNDTAITPAADVYSLGIVLYELLCGVTPFEGGSHMAVIRRQSDAAPGRPAGVPDPLWQGLQDMLAKDPEARPSAAQVVARMGELSQSLGGAPAAVRLQQPPAATPLGAASADTVLNVPRTAFEPPSDQPSTPSAASPVSSFSPSHTSSSPPESDEISTSDQDLPKRRKKGLAVAASVLGVLLIGAAVVLGVWFLNGDEPAAIAQPTETPTAAFSGSATPESTQTAIEPEPEPSTPEPSPTPTEDETEEIQLMPDVVGMPLTQAQAELRGVAVTVVDEYTDKYDRNEVIAQSVEADELLPTSVELTVAKPPASVYLVNVGSVQSQRFGTGSGHLNGNYYAHSLLSTSDAGHVEYNLSRGYRRLVGTVGRADDAGNAALKVQVDVFVDSTKLWSETVGLGDEIELDLDVTNGLRLRLEYTAIDPGWSDRADVVYGDIRLIGIPGEMPDLEGE